jgi:UDP-glucose 4-epimerase
VTNIGSVRYGAVRAVVTGGAGFIGSNLVDALIERGDEVVVVDNLATGRREHVHEAAEFLEHDIREPMPYEADVVFHLAAQADVGTSVQRPAYDADVNVTGTVCVLEAAREAGARVVFSSTGGAIYGDVDAPANEEHPRRPVSPYGTAKLAAEEYLQTWNRLYGAGHVVLRFANVYGPRQDSSLEGGVVAIFLERMARGEETLIFGDGGHERDYVHVDDVVAALLAAAAGEGGVYNVGTGRATSVSDLHELCRRVSGSQAEPRFVEPRAGDARRSVLDCARAERELAWRPEVPLEQGLRSTWEWVQAAASG